MTLRRDGRSWISPAKGQNMVNEAYPNRVNNALLDRNAGAER
jgi:hypothetical protein